MNVTDSIKAMPTIADRHVYIKALVISKGESVTNVRVRDSDVEHDFAIDDERVLDAEKVELALRKLKEKL